MKFWLVDYPRSPSLRIDETGRHSVRKLGSQRQLGQSDSGTSEAAQNLGRRSSCLTRSENILANAAPNGQTIELIARPLPLAAKPRHICTNLVGALPSSFPGVSTSRRHQGRASATIHLYLLYTLLQGSSAGIGHGSSPAVEVLSTQLRRSPECAPCIGRGSSASMP
jgi:hypothetical protein